MTSSNYIMLALCGLLYVSASAHNFGPAIGVIFRHRSNDFFFWKVKKIRKNFFIPEKVVCVCFLIKKQLFIYQQGALLWLFSGKKQTNKHKIGCNCYSSAHLLPLVFEGKKDGFLLHFFFFFFSQPCLVTSSIFQRWCTQTLIYLM